MGKTTGIDVAIDKYRIKKFVNKEKGTVTLKLAPEYCEVHKMLKEVCDQLRINKDLRFLIIRSPYLDFDPKRFIATAKCGPKDKFDENVGASIAFRKLKGKVRRNVIHSLLDIMNDCNGAVASLYDLYMRDKLQAYTDISPTDLYDLEEMIHVDDLNWDDEEDYDE